MISVMTYNTLEKLVPGIPRVVCHDMTPPPTVCSSLVLFVDGKTLVYFVGGKMLVCFVGGKLPSYLKLHVTCV